MCAEKFYLKWKKNALRNNDAALNAHDHAQFGIVLQTHDKNVVVHFFLFGVDFCLEWRRSPSSLGGGCWVGLLDLGVGCWVFGGWVARLGSAVWSG